MEDTEAPKDMLSNAPGSLSKEDGSEDDADGQSPEYYIVAGTWNAAKSREAYREIHAWLKSISQSIYHQDIPTTSTSTEYASQQAVQHVPRVPDIVAIGIQEWTGLFQNSHPDINSWCEELQNSLESNFPTAKYDILRYAQWVGLVLFVAIKTPMPPFPKKSQNSESKTSRNSETHSLYLKSMHSAYVGTGPLGLGNKGAVGMMIHLSAENINDKKAVSDVNICFLNAHLTAHSGFIKDRRSSYRQICHMMRFPMPVKVPITTTSTPTSPRAAAEGQHVSIDIPTRINNIDADFASQQDRNNHIQRPFIEINSMVSIFDADIIIWMGDLNYRLYDPSFAVNKQKKGSRDNSYVSFDPHTHEENPGGTRAVAHNKVAPESQHINVSGPLQTRPQFITSTGAVEQIPVELRVSPRPNPDQYYPPFEQFDVLTKIPKSHSSDGKRDLSTPSVQMPFTPNFYSDLTSCIYAREWDKLLEYDQLSFDRRNGMAFGEFSEAKITFPPTYKYRPGSNYLNLEDWKLHWPAWCDRILFATKEHVLKNNIPPQYLSIGDSSNACTWDIRPLIYNSCPTAIVSDHKPVYALFKLTVSTKSSEKAQNVMLFAPFAPGALEISDLQLDSREASTTRMEDSRIQTPKSLVVSVYQKLPTRCDRWKQKFGRTLTWILMIPRWTLIICIMILIALLIVIIVHAIYG